MFNKSQLYFISKTKVVNLFQEMTSRDKRDSRDSREISVISDLAVVSFVSSSLWSQKNTSPSTTTEFLVRRARTTLISTTTQFLGRRWRSRMGYYGLL